MRLFAGTPVNSTQVPVLIRVGSVSSTHCGCVVMTSADVSFVHVSVPRVVVGGSVLINKRPIIPSKPVVADMSKRMRSFTVVMRINAS